MGMMNKNLLVIMAMCCIFTGCMGKSIPPANIYTISTQWGKNSTAVREEKKNAVSIKLAPIQAARAFAGTAILYGKARYEQNNYAYSRWSDAPVRLLKILFQSALEESGRFEAVVSSSSASEADFLVESTLYDFSQHINSDETSDGVIRIRFNLVNNMTKKIMATQEFMSRVPADTLNARGAAAALNRAALNVARDLTRWLAEPGRCKQ